MIVDNGPGFPHLRLALNMQPAGTAIEFGVASGTSTRMIAAVMPVVGFDSWQGLPSDWTSKHPAGSMKCPKPSIENALLVEGWFSDTLPGFDFAQYDIGLVHIDCDLYSSTATAFDHVGPHLKPGCLMVLDDYLPGDPHVARAFHEAVAAYKWDVDQISTHLFVLRGLDA